LAVKIRLQRIGAKKKPAYKIVIADSRRSRDGKIIAQVGFYNPMSDPAKININLSEAQNWISKGAQPTDTVKYLLNQASKEQN
jgi:small subunit ribosomal protein S16